VSKRLEGRTNYTKRPHAAWRSHFPHP